MLRKPLKAKAERRRLAICGCCCGGGLEIIPQTVDRYGRTVGEVIAGGRNVNLEMVRAGVPYAYRDYLSGCDENAYLNAENQAEMRRLGVWRYGGEQRPWDFRKQR